MGEESWPCMNPPREHQPYDNTNSAFGDQVGSTPLDDVVMSLDDPANALLEAPPESDAGDPLEIYLNKEQHKKLQEYLGKLPPERRRMVELHFGLIDGRCHTIAEIALELGTTIKDVRINIHLAINYGVCVYPKRSAALKDPLED